MERMIPNWAVLLPAEHEACCQPAPLKSCIISTLLQLKKSKSQAKLVLTGMLLLWARLREWQLPFRATAKSFFALKNHQTWRLSRNQFSLSARKAKINKIFFFLNSRSHVGASSSSSSSSCTTGRSWWGWQSGMCPTIPQAEKAEPQLQNQGMHKGTSHKETKIHGGVVLEQAEQLEIRKLEMSECLWDLSLEPDLRIRSTSEKTRAWSFSVQEFRIRKRSRPGWTELCLNWA